MLSFHNMVFSSRHLSSNRQHHLVLEDEPLLSKLLRTNFTLSSSHTAELDDLMQNLPLTSDENSYTPSSDNNQSNQTSNNNNKRPRSFTPEQERDIESPGDSSSPKRTMSEEHLQSRESSPVVSLPTGENATNTQIPTKMAEVFPPLAGEVDKVVSSEGLSGTDSGQVPVAGNEREGAENATAGNMLVDNDEREKDQAVSNASSVSPTLREQFEIVRGTFNILDNTAEYGMLT